MNEIPQISIVTVTYNCAVDVMRTIHSVTEQIYSNWELCIVDGCSTDGTTILIDDFISNNPNLPILFISEPDKGIYDAMNKAIDMVSGKWIFFLNVGDILSSPNTLSKLFKNDINNYDAVYTDVILNKDNKLIYKKSSRPFFSPNHLYLDMGFGHQSVVVKTYWAKKLHFDLNFRCCADYKMIKTIFDGGGRFIYVPMSIATTDVVEGFSDKHALLQLEELAVISKKKYSIKYFIIRFRVFVSILLHKLKFM